jgi:hypothetical protein
MRRNIALVLIICGTFLALAPVLSDLVQGLQMAQAMGQPAAPTDSTFLRQPLDGSFQVASWLMGGAMVTLGAVGGRRQNPSRTTDHDS